MVNITRTDLGLLISMFLAVWLLTTVFGMAGLASSDFNASNAPTLNLSDTDVDVVPEPGAPPLGPNQFRISNDSDERYPTIRELNSTTTIEVNDCPRFGYGNCAWNYRLAIPGNNGGPIIVERNLSTEGNEAVLDFEDVDPAENWRVIVELEDNSTGQSIVTVDEQPGTSGFFASIGSLFDSATDFVGSAVANIAHIVQSLVAQTINTLIQLAILAGRVGGFAVDYVGFVFGGYIAITTSAASGFAAPVLILPLLVLSFEMFKFGLATIESIDPLIPFT